MFVQGLGHTLFAENKPHSVSKSGSPKDTVKKNPFRITDSFEPSDSPERKELLLSIKKRIRTGYYNTEPVLEDLSHGFAKILNQIQ
jgi:hypothetical protein